MFRFDLGQFYKAGELIHPLTVMSDEKSLSDVFPALFFASEHIKLMMPLLHTSWANADKLTKLLAEHIDDPDFSKTFDHGKFRQ